MPSFRILNQAPQYFLNDVSPNAGGKLYFYENDLGAPKDTWSDESLTVLNANPVVLDAAGRTTTDVWGDGEYGVVMTDADDVVIWTRNNVRADAGADQAIPALETGKFLTNDGSNLSWAEIREVPDPTDLSNYYLVSDGTGTPVWQQIPEPEPPPESDIAITSTMITIGDGEGGLFAIQRGTGTAPAAPSARVTSVGITFGTPFTALWHVSATVTVAGVSSAVPSGFPADAITGWTPGSGASGCTVNFRIPSELDNASDDTITNPVPFSWIAFGLVAA